MAALLPALSGLASAVTAVVSKTKRNKQKSSKGAPSKAVVVYNESLAKSQLLRAAKRAKRTGRTQRLSLRDGTGLGYRPIGLQSAAFIGKSTFKPCGAADAVADISADGSLKIVGRGLCGRLAGGVMDGRIAVGNFSATRGVIGVNGLTAVTGSFGPAALDPRLGVIASIYAYYAIRALDLHYVPAVSQYNYATGSAPTASGSTSLVTFGLTDQTDYVSTVAPASNQQIADLPASCTGPLYQPMTLQYRHKGTRVWYTSNQGNTSDLNEAYQLIVCGMLAAVPPAGASDVNVGSFHGDWEVDFYRPMYVETAVSAVHRAIGDGPTPVVPVSALTGDLKDHKESGPPGVVKPEVAFPVSKDPPPACAMPALKRTSSRDSVLERAIAHVRAAHYPAASSAAAK